LPWSHFDTEIRAILIPILWHEICNAVPKRHLKNFDYNEATFCVKKLIPFSPLDKGKNEDKDIAIAIRLWWIMCVKLLSVFAKIRQK